MKNPQEIDLGQAKTLKKLKLFHTTTKHSMTFKKRNQIKKPKLKSLNRRTQNFRMIIQFVRMHRENLIQVLKAMMVIEGLRMLVRC